VHLDWSVQKVVDMKIGFVGAGKMAEAILSSLLDSGVCKAVDITASDISPDRCAALEGLYGVCVTSENRNVVEASDVVVLAVKPQELDGVLAGLASCAAGKLVISIAAGKPLAYFASKLPGARLVRVMPNLACQVGEGMSVFCGANDATAEDLERVDRIFGASGRALQLDESLFDVVTALSGSGPAFFAFALDALVQGAVAEGMPPATAALLAGQTMLGTAKVLLERGLSAEVFMSQVASKGGTTAAGLAVLNDGSVKADMAAAIAAASGRSRELSA
jgi:pyrroline-5-carboxylate reductase